MTNREEYLESVRRGLKQLSKEDWEVLRFEMSMPSVFYDKPKEEQEMLWQMYLAFRDLVGADMAALMIRLELAEDTM